MAAWTDYFPYDTGESCASDGDARDNGGPDEDHNGEGTDDTSIKNSPETEQLQGPQPASLGRLILTIFWLIVAILLFFFALR